MIDRYTHLTEIGKAVRLGEKSIIYATNGLLLTFIPTPDETATYVDLCRKLTAILDALDKCKAVLCDLTYLADDGEN